MAGDPIGDPLAHVADPEGDEEAGEGRLPGALEAPHEVLRRLRPHALETCQRLDVEIQEEVGQALHQPLLDELVHQLLAEPLHVERAAAREVAQVVLDLGRAVEVGAARDDFVLEAHGLRPADRAAAGRRNFRVRRGRFDFTTLTIWGITSPAR